MAIIKVRGLEKNFGRLEVLRGIDLDVAEGEKLVIIGPSGSGKSTLLRCLNHLRMLQRAPSNSTDVNVTDKKTDLPKVREHDRHGLSELQPVPAHERHRQHHHGPAQGEEDG